MKNNIGVSTGIFARILLEDDLELMVNKLLDYNIKLIEILVARPRLTDLRFNAETLKRLEKIDVLVHAPFFKEEGFEDPDLDTDLISRTEKFAKHVNANHIVIHPDLIRDWNRVKSIKIPAHIENLSPERCWSLEKMKKLVEENPNFKITFDGSHAEKWGDGEANHWAKELNPYIESIHLNNKDGYKSVINDTWTPDQYILNYKGTFILEKTPFDFDLLPEIVKKIKNILNY